MQGTLGGGGVSTVLFLLGLGEKTGEREGRHYQSLAKVRQYQ